jgi:glutamate/tyrosine decarboxylase-like PLP-dependent enzyme
MGGVTLTYLARLGETIPPWNFAVPGVTSISVDLHKYGYTAKGAGVLVHRDKRLRSYQTFVTDNWLGGLYGSSGLLGTKSGGAIAAAWAVLHHLGEHGYRRVTAAARAACLELAATIGTIPELRLLAEPQVTLLAVAATDPAALDVDAVADVLRAEGWYVDRQGPPPSLHCMVNAVHSGRIADFGAALRSAVAEVAGRRSVGGRSAYGTVE